MAGSNKKQTPQKKKREFMKIDMEWITNDSPKVVLSPELQKSSLITFIASGFFRLLLGMIICAILINISVSLVSNNIVRDQWLDILSETDFLETECIGVAECLNGPAVDPERYPRAAELFDSDLLEMLRDQPPVEKLYGFDNVPVRCIQNGSRASLMAAFPETYDLLKYPIPAVSSLNSAVSDSELPSAVVSGPDFAGITVGQVITITVDPETIRTYDDSAKYIASKGTDFRVVAKVGFPYTTLRDGFIIGNDKSPYFSVSGENRVFVLHDEKTVEALKEADIRLTPGIEDFFVIYKLGAPDWQIREFHELIYGMMPAEGYESFGLENLVRSTISLFPKDFTKPMPSVFRSIFHPVSTLLIAICIVICVLVMVSVVRKIIYGKGVEGSGRIHFSDILITSILFGLGSVLPPALLHYYRCTLVIDHYGQNGVSPLIAWDIITSRYFLICMAFMLAAVVGMVIASVLFSYRRCKLAKQSEELSKESYVYRPTEYFTEDSYQPNDFDVADYDLLKEDGKTDNKTDNKTDGQ